MPITKYLPTQLTLGVGNNKITSRTKDALTSDAFMVGGMRTHAQLFEADQLLLKGDRIKSGEELAHELKKLNVEFNKNHINAEYNFALGSIQAVAREEAFVQDDEGEKATTLIGKDGVNRLAIFRYNPAEKKIVLPPKHPYRATK